MKPLAIILFTAAAITAEMAMARMPGPPPEAVQACANQSVGTQCSFTGRRGEVEGQCAETPQGEMACMPEGGPPEGEERPDGPPPRAE